MLAVLRPELERARGHEHHALDDFEVGDEGLGRFAARDLLLLDPVVDDLLDLRFLGRGLSGHRNGRRGRGQRLHGGLGCRLGRGLRDDGRLRRRRDRCRLGLLAEVHGDVRQAILDHVPVVFAGHAAVEVEDLLGACEELILLVGMIEGALEQQHGQVDLVGAVAVGDLGVVLVEETDRLLFVHGVVIVRRAVDMTRPNVLLKPFDFVFHAALARSSVGIPPRWS